MVHRSLVEAVEAKARQVPGSLDYQRAELAESAIAWLWHALQDEVELRVASPGDLDAELRQLLDEGRGCVMPNGWLVRRREARPSGRRVPRVRPLAMALAASAGLDAPEDEFEDDGDG